MRLEKLIMKNPISDFFTETFDLLSAGQFENLVFRPQSQGGQICVSWAHPLGPGLGPPTWAHPLGPGLGPPTWAQLGPQTPPAPPPAAPDEFSNPDPGPSQRTHYVPNHGDLFCHLINQISCLILAVKDSLRSLRTP